jgi:hypothetical protein
MASASTATAATGIAAESQRQPTAHNTHQVFCVAVSQSVAGIIHQLAQPIQLRSHFICDFLIRRGNYALVLHRDLLVLLGACV